MMDGHVHDASQRILLIMGHPRPDSLSDSLAAAYEAAAVAAGADVRVLRLRELKFDPSVRVAHINDQALEPDLILAQEWLNWCDHAAFFYPTWWAGTPALVKGFLDRVLTSHFAFIETTGGTGFEGLLHGKSAQVVTTMDTPKLVYRWIVGRPGELAMRRGTLGFCGMSPVRVLNFGPVKSSTLEQRNRWIRQASVAGETAAGGLTWWEVIRQRLAAWLLAMRLQFYPMTWLAYTAGAMGAAQFHQTKFQWTTYLLGYGCLFFLELSTVFTNDVFDFESDRRNEWYGPFTGGSRSLVDERLTRSQLITGSWVAAFLSCVAGVAACGADGTLPGQSLIVLFVLAFLAIGYTVPPLKFSHRGLGELDVGLTHSVGVILCGYVLQAGGWGDAFPWLLSAPLFLAILPAILLAGVPDRLSDEAAGKRTLCVRLGSRHTVLLAAVLSIAAVLSAIGSNGLSGANHVYRHIGWFVVPHSLWLISRLGRLYRRIDQPQRIDGTIAVALLFILWFAIVPVVNLTFGGVP